MLNDSNRLKVILAYSRRFNDTTRVIPITVRQRSVAALTPARQTSRSVSPIYGNRQCRMNTSLQIPKINDHARIPATAWMEGIPEVGGRLALHKGEDDGDGVEDDLGNDQSPEEAFASPGRGHDENEQKDNEGDAAEHGTQSGPGDGQHVVLEGGDILLPGEIEGMTTDAPVDRNGVQGRINRLTDLCC